jgi:hypothetical protein
MKSPAEQIVDFLINTTRQKTVDVKLFDSDLLKSYGIVGFLEHKSNKIGIAIFRNINYSSVRLVKCYFSERLLKRATDIYVYYYTVENNPCERFLLILNNNPKLAKIVVNANENIAIKAHSIPSITLVPFPDFPSGGSYAFYDAQDNEINLFAGND